LSLNRRLNLLGRRWTRDASRHDKHRQRHPRNPASCHQGSGQLHHHTDHRFNLSSSFAGARHETGPPPCTACCRTNVPVKTGRGTAGTSEVKTFDDDVFPTVSRTISQRRPYGCGALAPVLRAVTALMLLQQAKLEALKIGGANDRMRLRSAFRDVSMLRLAIAHREAETISEGRGGIYAAQPLCARSTGSCVTAHARPTASMTRKSTDGAD
jgi:hypothetical protein